MKTVAAVVALLIATTSFSEAYDYVDKKGIRHWDHYGDKKPAAKQRSILRAPRALTATRTLTAPLPPVRETAAREDIRVTASPFGELPRKLGNDAIDCTQRARADAGAHALCDFVDLETENHRN